MAVSGKRQATDRKVRALKPKAVRYDVWFMGGLGLRVGVSGKRTWQTMVRVDGKQRRIFLGEYPPIGVARANTLCAQAREKAKKGEDPATVVECGAPRAQKNTDKLTVSRLIDLYITRYAEVNKRSAGQDRRFLETEIKPHWGDTLAADIKRRDVMAVLDEIVARGSPVTANRVLAVTRKMFNWAVGRDMLEATPCTAIEKPYRETERDRILATAEIRSFWNGLDLATVDPLLRHALKFLLATGQRRSEVIRAKWDAFDFENDCWEIPAERTKVRRAHRLPLSTVALALLDDVAGFTASSASDWVFVNMGTAEPYSPYSVSQAMRKSLKHFDFTSGPATPHDLRRTFASGITELGFPRLIAGKLLNHSETGVTARVYDKHEYAREKKMAIDAWATRLTAIVSGPKKRENVVQLTRKAG